MTDHFSSDDDVIEMLDRACEATFDPWPRPQALNVVNVAVTTGFTVAELADQRVLGGLATPDVAMTMVKMLGRCVLCLWQAPVPLVALDEDLPWFYLSLDYCPTCFASRAAEMHTRSRERKGKRNGVDSDTPVSLDEGARGVTRGDAVRLLHSLADQGKLRSLFFGPGKCRRLLRGRRDECFTALAYSPRGESVLTSSGDVIVRQFDAASGVYRGILAEVTAEVMVYSPDGGTIATSSGGVNVQLWDLASRQRRTTLQGHDSDVWAVSYSPDGVTIASGSNDGSGRLWDAVSGECRHVLRGHTECVKAVGFSPDSKTLATGSDDCTVRLWAVACGELRRILRFPMRSVSAVAFSPDGGTLAAGTCSGTVWLWDTASSECRRKIQEHTCVVTALAFSPDGSMLAVGAWDHAVWLWDMMAGRCQRGLGHNGNVLSVAFSPDGSTIATAMSMSATVWLWDTRKLSCLVKDTLQQVDAGGVAPTDNRQAITGTAADEPSRGSQDFKRHRDERA